MDRPIDDRVDNFFAHFGVKGMRWGVRRNSTQAPGSEDHERATAAKSKARKSGVKTLSNKELLDAITRMNLERQYQQLNPSKTRRAAQFVSSVLGNVGKQQAIKLANDFAAKQVATAMKR